MEYDLNAYYLYGTGYSYKVGQIERINDKTITMKDRTKIKKDTFKESTHQLSESEVNVYRNELYKILSRSTYLIRDNIHELKRLKNMLNSSEFVQLNTEKLQESLDKMQLVIEEQLVKAVEINNKKYLFSNEYSDTLIEGK